jgi:myosin-1
MTLLSTITNEAINDNLKARFNNQEIYVSSVTTDGVQLTAQTYIAHVLISVNPFRGKLAISDRNKADL